MRKIRIRKLTAEFVRRFNRWPTASERRRLKKGRPPSRPGRVLSGRDLDRALTMAKLFRRYQGSLITDAELKTAYEGARILKPKPKVWGSVAQRLGLKA